MGTRPLFRAFPRLAGHLPVAGLVEAPTPVETLAPGLHIKRDDLTAPDFGGNKVRKLDFLLADARRRGARELLTFGYAGSNFVAATAWHGRKLGLKTIAWLLAQPDAEYVASNLSVGLAAGAELHLRRSRAGVVAGALARSAAALLRSGHAPLWIPPGGSTPLGTVGFVDAAFELREQVRAGALEEPDVIYVAFSSMGTVAGLALGLEYARLKTRIEAVQVAGTEYASWVKLESLMRQTSRWLARLEPALDAGRALERVQVRSEFLGAGYAQPAEGTRPAMQRFTDLGGVRADPTYTGKALAGLFHDRDVGRLRGRTALYWHTLSARSLPDGVERARAAVPPSLRGYFPG